MDRGGAGGADRPHCPPPFAFAAQHHFLFRSNLYWDDTPDDPAFFAARRTILGADCWIGHSAIIKPQVTIGIGAIVAGCPATPLRMRFAAPVIDRLLALAWWDWDLSHLRAALHDFRTLTTEAFLEKHGG